MKAQNGNSEKLRLPDKPLRLDKASDFGLVYEAYAEKIWRHIYLRMHNNLNEANDLTTEVFLKTWEYLRSGKKIRNVKSFLYRTTNNLIIDRHRAKQRNIEVQLEEEQEEYLLASDPNPDTIIQITAKNVISEALQQLPEKERNLLIMRFIDELEIKEIAATLGKSQGAVTVALHRALKSLGRIVQNNENNNRNNKKKNGTV